MRPVLQKKKKNYKLLVIYILIAIICIVGIGMALYMQYFQDEKLGVIFGITDSEEEDKYNDLKNNFNNIFTNDVENMQDGKLNMQKINQNFDIVATRYKYSKQTEDTTLEVTIPNINIKSDLITEFNEHVKNTYKEQVDKCKASNEGYIYNVKYKAYIQENILSLIIYAELKEGSNNQRLMIETYNYDIVNEIIQHKDEYEGKAILFLGYIDNTKESSDFIVISRQMIKCCQADKEKIQIKAKGIKDDLEEGQWINIYGRICFDDDFYILVEEYKMQDEPNDIYFHDHL